MIYILVEKDPINPVGVFSSEATAKAHAIEGDYLIVPVELDRLYGGGIASDAMVGAITIKATATALSEAVALVMSRLDTIDNQISNAASTLADFGARITALEG